MRSLKSRIEQMEQGRDRGSGVACVVQYAGQSKADALAMYHKRIDAIRNAALTVFVQKPFAAREGV